MLPKRKQKPRMGVKEPSVIRCPGHVRWVRQSFQCAIADKAGHECGGRIEFHHVETRGSGGGDETGVPLCSVAHATGHTIGWVTFGQRYGVDLEQMHKDLWRASPHRIKYEAQQ